MAEIQDLEVDSSDEHGELETVEKQIDQQKETEAEQELPTEYRGKSVADVARMHQEAVRLAGRHSQEIAEVRQLADELIKSQLKKQPEPEPVKEVDFFENPQEAIRRAVETNPRVVAAETYAIQAQKMQAQQRLVQLHPDFGQIVQDGSFVEWIKGSKVRMKLFQEAEAYDVDAADELLSTFKQLKQVKAEKPKVDVPDEEKASRTKTLQSAAVDTGGSGESSKKVYRRSDLIRLKMRDPSKFDSMQAEIDAAYREGRVR